MHEQQGNGNLNPGLELRKIFCFVRKLDNNVLFSA